MRLGHGHALNAMHAALVFEPLENIRAGHLKNNFLKTTEVGWIGVERFNLPFARFGVTEKHPVKIGGEQRGFRTAGAGADFNNRVARIGRVWWHEAELDLLRELFFLCLEPRHFFARKLSEFRIGQFALKQRTVFG